jgi:Bacterial membrane protein YfhO
MAHGRKRHNEMRTDGSNQRRALPHILGLGWVVGSALLVLAPALHHGFSLGPYDILSQSGLTQASGVTARNSATGDQIAEMIPWSTLAWVQVHQGHLPLWNPFNGLGLPLAFNWQSAAFSLPTVVSYIFPLHLAYTVQIIVTLVVAGTGAYVLARVLHVGVIGCATAGVIFELSGSFMGWLGYPHASVMSWAGWLLAVAILIVRGGHRIRNIAIFAVILAFAVYAGQPEILAMLVVCAIVIVVTMVVVLKVRAEDDGRGWVRPLLDLALAVGAGIALGAPLVLPGLQILSRSTRDSASLVAQTEVGKALPPHDLVHLLVQGYNGLPIAGSHVFGDAVYFDTAAYVGIVGIALAILGLLRNWRQPEVVSFTVLACVSGAIVFAPPVEALFLHLPLVQTIDWHRELMPLGLCFAILAAVGMDHLVRNSAKRSTQLLLGGVLTAGLTLLAILWLVGTSELSSLETTLRRNSLIWPAVTTGLALALVGVLVAWTSKARTPNPSTIITAAPTEGGRGRRSSVNPSRFQVLSVGHLAGGSLLLLETAFLVVSGAQLWASSAQGISSNPAVATLMRSVGQSTVGFGAFTCFDGPATTDLGILPETNILFGVHEFDFYDPILPHAYFESWAEVSQSEAGVPIFNSFCPSLTTASQARRFGVKYVLEAGGAAGPMGADFVRKVGNEDLYRIPDSGDATLTPMTAQPRLPPVNVRGTPVAVVHSSPSSWRITTNSASDQVLRLRLTDEPGWRATIDGRPLAIVPYAVVMIQARIPPGHHVIELQYWPPLFTAGLIAAGCCIILLLTALIVARAYRNKRGVDP